MALILKQGESINDNYGNTYTEAYAVIDQIDRINKKTRFAMVTLGVYANKTVSDNLEFSPIHQYTFEIKDEYFDYWLSPQAVSEDKDHYAQAYKFILSEKPEVGFDFDKWESDE